MIQNDLTGSDTDYASREYGFRAHISSEKSHRLFIFLDIFTHISPGPLKFCRGYFPFHPKKFIMQKLTLIFILSSLLLKFGIQALHFSFLQRERITEKSINLSLSPSLNTPYESSLAHILGMIL